MVFMTLFLNLLNESDQFENVEERRLFYVAMKHAKERRYLELQTIENGPSGVTVIMLVDISFRSGFEAQIVNPSYRDCEFKKEDTSEKLPTEG